MLADHLAGCTVGNDQQHIGQQRLFQRRMKRIDQRMRQLADETNGINQQKLAAGRRFDRANHRIERGEQLILRQHVRAAQRIEQGRFSGVGVTDQRHNRHLVFLSSGAPETALAAQFINFPAQVAHPSADAPPVHFQPRFARAARADTAAQAGHGHAVTEQARKLIRHLRQFNLQAPLAGLRPLRKNIQNQRRSVDDLCAAQNIFEISRLHAG